jgi:hypothetical protein
MPVNTDTETIVIANGESLSGAVHLRSHRLFAIQMPASWTAADLTFQASYDGSTYADVYDEDDAEVVVQAAASRFIILDPAKFLGMQRIKVRSGTTGVAVNQGGARSLQLILVG